MTRESPITYELGFAMNESARFSPAGFASGGNSVRCQYQPENTEASKA